MVVWFGSAFQFRAENFGWECRKEQSQPWAAAKDGSEKNPMELGLSGRIFMVFAPVGPWYPLHSQEIKSKAFVLYFSERYINVLQAYFKMRTSLEPKSNGIFATRAHFFTRPPRSLRCSLFIGLLLVYVLVCAGILSAILHLSW
jgi:hypothetical protein